MEESTAFNLGTGTGYSVREVIDAARDVTGCEIPERVSARRPGDPARLVAVADKARTGLGWQPAYTTLRSIVESAWDWHQRNPNGYDD